MNSINILASGSYLPKRKIENKILNQQFQLEEDYIYQRTGIETRYFAEKETVEEMALKATQNLLESGDKEAQQIEMIIVATTTPNQIMPGISYYIQDKLDIQNCICMDLLAGCSGYINAFDMARSYLAIGKVKTALVIGVDRLSQYTDRRDIGTAIILSDGAGATLLGVSKKEKEYHSLLESQGQKGELLTFQVGDVIQMKGKEIYRYAVTVPVENVKKLMEQTGKKVEQMKYIIPHQSNQKIMKAIQNRLRIEGDKMVMNIKTVGNTFCASIPIALDEIRKKEYLQTGDLILMLGYGGGLNTGSILWEV